MARAIARHAEPPGHARSCDNMSLQDDGSWLGECPICRAELTVAPAVGNWAFRCAGDCTHEELVRWLSITDLRAERAASSRAWTALMLATTPEIWQALLEGRPVAREALDQDWLARTRRLRVV